MIPEDERAENDRPDHLAVLCRAYPCGGRKFGGPHQDQIGEGGQKAVAREKQEFFVGRGPIIGKHCHKAYGYPAQNAGSEKGDLLLGGVRGAKSHHRNRTSKPGEDGAEMAERELPESRVERDDDAEQSQRDGGPAVKIDLLLQEQDRDDGDIGRLQKHQHEGFGHRQMGECRHAAHDTNRIGECWFSRGTEPVGRLISIEN